MAALTCSYHLRYVSSSPSVSLSLFVVVRRVFVTMSLRCLYEASTPPGSTSHTFIKTKSLYIYIHYIARPLLTLLQASFGLSASSGTLITGPLHNLPMILGLQNDVLGFDKDYATGNPLSAVQLLIRDGMDKQTALLRIVGHHNKLVTAMMAEANRFTGTEAEKAYVDAASRWPNAMAKWMLSCQRYKVT